MELDKGQYAILVKTVLVILTYNMASERGAPYLAGRKLDLVLVEDRDRLSKKRFSMYTLCTR